MLKHILTNGLIQICFFCTNVYAGGGGADTPIQKIILNAPQGGGGSDGVTLIAAIIGGIAVVLAAAIPVILKRNKDD